MMRPFRYCMDPVFLASLLLYAMNRVCVAPRWGAAAPFLANHFDDVLLIPCALPVLLWLQRLARLRTHDLPPTPGEIGGTLALWALLFEVAFPRFAGLGVGDPRDVLAYAAGALLASFAWALSHRHQATPTVIDRRYSGATPTVIDRRYSEAGNTHLRTDA